VTQNFCRAEYARTIKPGFPRLGILGLQTKLARNKIIGNGLREVSGRTKLAEAFKIRLKAEVSKIKLGNE
jgi:hypothetical protein